MRSILFLLFGVLIVSCSPSGTSQETSPTLKKLKKINDSVARENKCKLTTEYSDERQNELTLVLDSSNGDPNLPGKVLLEYFLYADTENLRFLRFHLVDNNKKPFYDLTRDQLISITDKCSEAKGTAYYIDELDYSSAYAAFDSSVSEKIKFDEFEQQLKTLDLTNTSFSGFQLSKGLIQIAYSNSKNRLLLVYKLDDPENKLFGLHVE